jgi:mannonate dehydratase
MPKITSARTIVTCPGRNFVTLKIETDDGVSGVGDATLNGRELSVASYLDDHVIPCLIGRDAHQIEDIWQYLYRGAYWRRGPVTMSAISAVDMALWDIKGKLAGLPVYQLLGGASRTGVMVYGHANGETVEETLDSAQAYKEEGYKAIRLQSGCPASRPPMACPRTSRTTSLRMRICRRRRSGRRPGIFAARPDCSRPPASGSAGMCTCCMTSTTA